MRLIDFTVRCRMKEWSSVVISGVVWIWHEERCVGASVSVRGPTGSAFNQVELEGATFRDGYQLILHSPHHNICARC